jgi:hypothetical protein
LKFSVYLSGASFFWYFCPDKINNRCVYYILCAAERFPRTGRRKHPTQEPAQGRPNPQDLPDRPDRILPREFIAKNNER